MATADSTRISVEQYARILGKYVQPGSYIITLIGHHQIAPTLSEAIQHSGAVEVRLPCPAEVCAINAAIEQYCPAMVIIDDTILDQLEDQDIPHQDTVSWFTVGTDDNRGYLDRLAAAHR